MTRAEDTAEPQPVDQTGEERQPTVRRRPPRGAGLLTTMLGAFCLTAALLLPLVVAPRLALLPAEFHYTWTLLDPHATYLDTAHWQTRENVEVKQTVSTRGTPVPGAPGLVAVATTIDTHGPLGAIGFLEYQRVVDRASGRIVDCCGTSGAGSGARTGLWPPGTAEAAFAFHDPETHAAPVMRLDGIEDRDGLTVHRYRQEIPPTRVPGSVRDVPAAALGLDRKGTVRAERWVEAVRVYWVEPSSGQVVDLAEQRRETLRALDSDHERLLLDADLEAVPSQVGRARHLADTQVRLLRAVQEWGPLVLGVCGAVLVASGMLLARRAARATS